MAETETTLTTKIFSYFLNEDMVIKFKEDEPCENIIKRICMKMDICPMEQFLYGIRVRRFNKKQDPTCYIPLVETLNPDLCYEFRVRFRCDLKYLAEHCPTTLCMMYCQLQYELQHELIPDIDYEHDRQKIYDMCMITLYLVLKQEKATKKEILQNLKNYLPKKTLNSILNGIKLKREYRNRLNDIRNFSMSETKAMQCYLTILEELSPELLYEEYACTTVHSEASLDNSQCIHLKCTMKVQNGKLRSHVSGNWTETPLEEISEVRLNLERGTVTMLLKNNPNETVYNFENATNEMNSFVSCLNGYFRLTVNWTMSVCIDLCPPLLKMLRANKCHGPIGGVHALEKLKRAGNRPGQFVLRMCGLVFGQYYIHIVRKPDVMRYEDPQTHVPPSGTPETFLFIERDEKFILLQDGEETGTFDDMFALAQSISIEAPRHERIPPSEHDKPPQLLMCAGPQKLAAVPQMVSDIDDEKKNFSGPIVTSFKKISFYVDEQQRAASVGFQERYGEWEFENGRKVNVTIRRLINVSRHVARFDDLVNDWCVIDCHAIARLYGITMFPKCLIFEDLPLGPLNAYLCNNRNKISLKLLVHIARTLTTAVRYLYDKNIKHGKIRCNRMSVKSADLPHSIDVKLCDYGIHTEYTDEDFPFIPYEYHNNLELARTDSNADFFAYATTLFEIFTYGAPINVSVEHLRNPSYILPPPKSIHKHGEIYDIMKEGWSLDPNARFDAQANMSRLSTVHDTEEKAYTDMSNVSCITASTELVSYVQQNGYSTTHSSSSSFDSLDKKIMNFSNPIILAFDTHETFGRHGRADSNGAGSNGMINRDEAEVILSRERDIVRTPTHNVYFYNPIGKGNFGEVYRGVLEERISKSAQQVALKVLPKNIEKSNQDCLDMEREAAIMKDLNHPNIVKIIDVIEEPSPILVMELMENGQLTSHLDSNKATLNMRTLLQFCADIASAMAYLEQRNVVHRDLAARNILVAKRDCVKISDFGLAQPTSDGYYSIRTVNRQLPIKWYAPETILTTSTQTREIKFSHASDVWSYGITLYEIFTFGGAPYPDIVMRRFEDVEPFYQRIVNGHRLKKPPACPQYVYDRVIMRSWSIVPKARPKFSEILDIINKYLSDEGESMEYRRFFV